MNRMLLFIVIGMICWTAPAIAQPPGPPDQRSFERIERLKKVRLIEMLELKEEQSVRFIARMNEHDQMRRELRKERSEELDKIERLVWNHAEKAEFDKVFGEIDAIEARQAEENRKFFQGLADILTDEQRGKLLLFERRFDVELREAMRDVRRRQNRMEGE